MTIFSMEYTPMFIGLIDGITTTGEYLRYLQSISVEDIEHSKQVWLNSHEDTGSELYEKTKKFKTYMDYYFETSNVYKEYLNIFNIIIEAYSDILNKANNPSSVFFDRNIIIGTNKRIQPKLCSDDLRNGLPVSIGGEGFTIYVDFSKVRSESTLPHTTFSDDVSMFNQAILIPLFNKRSGMLVRISKDDKKLVRSAINVTENKTEEDEKSLVRKA